MMNRVGTLVLASLLGLTGCAGMGRADARFQGTSLHAGPAPAITLTDDLGQSWSLADQHGTTVAVFFGYTHCPDTCPLTLAKLTRAVAQQGANSANVEIAFVTVDPERDTPAVMHRYIAHYSGAHIVGLTGTRSQVEQVERAYHVWAQRIPGKHAGIDDYDDAHSSVVYLIDRDGNQRVMHDDDDSLQAFTADIRTLAR